MPTPLDMLRLVEDLKNKKEELAGRPKPQEYYRARVVEEARRRMNIVSSAHAFGQSRDLMAPVSNEDLVKLKLAGCSASPENLLMKKASAQRRAMLRAHNLD